MTAQNAARWLLSAVLPLLGACAFEAGGGFTSLAPGELHAIFEPDGELLTDRGYRVQVSALSVQVDEFALLEAGAAEVSFDEIVHVEIDREVDLLAHEEIELAPYEPSAELGAGTIDRAELLVRRVAVSASVEGGTLQQPREIDAAVDVDAAITTPMALVLGRDLPEEIAPLVELRAGATLFDGIDFGALSDEDGIVEARLAEWVETAELVVDLGVVTEEHDQEDDEEEPDHEH